MKKQLENLTYILEEEKIQEDYINLKQNAKAIIKIFYHNSEYVHYEYFSSKNKHFENEIRKLENNIKHKLIKSYEIIL